MYPNFNLAEDCKIVKLFHGAANAVDCDYVSMKNAVKAWFVISHNGSTDTDLTLTVTEAADVAGTSAATVGQTCPIWTCVSTTSLDAFTRATDATALTIDPATQGTMLAIIEWDPAKHAEGLDCITLADSGGNASDTCVVLIVIQSKFAQASPPSAIVD